MSNYGKFPFWFLPQIIYMKQSFINAYDMPDAMLSVLVYVVGLIPEW